MKTVGRYYPYRLSLHLLSPKKHYWNVEIEFHVPFLFNLINFLYFSLVCVFYYYRLIAFYLFGVDIRPVRLAYQPPASSTFLSQ
jgi:hypothetical protein